MREKRFELLRVAPLDPKSSASASSATRAGRVDILRDGEVLGRTGLMAGGSHCFGEYTNAVPRKLTKCIARFVVIHRVMVRTISGIPVVWDTIGAKVSLGAADRGEISRSGDVDVERCGE
jgi:hypothetical protein